MGWGLSGRLKQTAKGAVLSVSDIRVPELCEGGCPCRSEDEHRHPQNPQTTRILAS